jgi:gluconokinase
MMVILMGVSGVGKTAIGERLARELGWDFLDADDFHPAANVEKMRTGIALTDADRWPWLALINQRLLALQSVHANAVLACSALKQTYRERLRQALSDVRVVFLHGSFELIQRRLQARQHRYMPATLLASQFATLEAPQDAINVDVDDTLDAIIAKIRRGLDSLPGASTMQNATLKVGDMSCEGCVASVTKILSSAQGVSEVQVSLADARAQIVFDPANTNLERLCAALDAAGYPSSPA